MSDISVLIDDLTKEQLVHLVEWLYSHGSFGKNSLTRWRQLYRDLHTWKRDPLVYFQQHISHCNFGEYAGVCKYGEGRDNCPALADGWRWLGEDLDRSKRESESVNDELLERILAAHLEVMRKRGRAISEEDVRELISQVITIWEPPSGAMASESLAVIITDVLDRFKAR